MKLQLIGTVELRDDGGRDLTPRSAKARAILAMLGRVPERRRGRRWLEGKLWSDRGADQASGSMRQALTEIRRALGEHAHRLISDRDTIAFPGLETDLDQDPEGARRALVSGREFLEGLDIGDQEFEDWLRSERLRLTVDHAYPADRRGQIVQAVLPLLVRPQQLPEGIGGFVGLALVDAIARLIGEFAEVEVFSDQGHMGPVLLPGRGMELSINGAASGGVLHMLVSLTALGSRQVLWSRRATLPLDQPDLIAEGEFPQIVFQAAEAAYAATAALPAPVEHKAWGDAAISLAMRDMFTFEADKLRRADRRLQDVLAAAPSARAYAWRGYLRQIMAVERTEPDWERLRAEADEFARKAVEVPGANPLVLALVSQVRVMLDANPEAGFALARDAAALSPFNAFTHAALSGAHLRMGRSEDALRAARRSASVAGRSIYSFWWDSLAGLAAMSMGQLEAATAFYQAAHVRAPSFRAPMRHLVVLHLVAGRVEKAHQVLADLRRVEPDFSLALIRDDPRYPAATLRRGNLLGRAMRAL
ncbi:hypothetical protein GEU84_003065 [Fertoebacter nigrum]|uniref:SARP family transcriptional regulator n=1 Tax=Fertoeibacter niger TaxID=2656921 RepID=A0A8X8GS80_9RHOB|nr:hypothetical protein [Fertoeibacter niger]NUB43353.1 hypothetical protein [Fertoeibacter niger]